MVECLDGLARITSKERATTHYVKGGTLQNACSTRPRVVAGLGKSAHMHTVRLMTSRLKGPKKNDDKSAVAMLKKKDWHESVREPVINYVKGHDRSGRPDEKRDHELKRGPGELRSYCGSRLVKFVLWISINFKDTFETGESFLIIFFNLVFFTYRKWNSESRARRSV